MLAVVAVGAAVRGIGARAEWPRAVGPYRYAILLGNCWCEREEREEAKFELACDNRP